MTAHAMEETAEELLDILDVETAVLTGEITRTMKDDPRGTRYVITGNAADGRTQVGIVGRFVAVDRVLIVTVYEVS
jgi:hypothetical protein